MSKMQGSAPTAATSQVPGTRATEPHVPSSPCHHRSTRRKHTYTQVRLRRAPILLLLSEHAEVSVQHRPRLLVPARGTLSMALAMVGAVLQGEGLDLMSPGVILAQGAPWGYWLGLGRGLGGRSPVSWTGGQASGEIQWASCSTRPAGHWQPGTQGLTQWAASSPRGTCWLKQVRGQGGPHSSNTKPRSRGQPTTAGGVEGKVTGTPGRCGPPATYPTQSRALCATLFPNSHWALPPHRRVWGPARQASPLPGGSDWHRLPGRHRGRHRPKSRGHRHIGHTHRQQRRAPAAPQRGSD